MTWATVAENILFELFFNCLSSMHFCHFTVLKSTNGMKYGLQSCCIFRLIVARCKFKPQWYIPKCKYCISVFAILGGKD